MDGNGAWVLPYFSVPTEVTPMIQVCQVAPQPQSVVWVVVPTTQWATAPVAVPMMEEVPHPTANMRAIQRPRSTSMDGAGPAQCQMDLDHMVDAILEEGVPRTLPATQHLPRTPQTVPIARPSGCSGGPPSPATTPTVRRAMLPKSARPEAEGVEAINPARMTYDKNAPRILNPQVTSTCPSAASGGDVPPPVPPAARRPKK